MSAASAVAAPVESDGGMFGWWRAGTPAGRKALIAAAMGWALDAFDVMLFSLTLASVIAEHGLTRALMGSILLYSIFTAACGLSTSLWQFAVFRALLGLGMGGEWASGAA